jgi:hypothetical protein
MMQVALRYGFAEGPALAKLFKQVVRNNGLNTTKKLSKADVIVAHSGGCLLVPKNNRAKLIILDNPPWWPGKKILTSSKQRAIRDLNFHRTMGIFRRWLIQSFHHLRYILSHLPKNTAIYRGHRRRAFPVPSLGQKIIIVRNLHDPFCSPDVMDLLPQAKDYQFVEFPGEHDDLWHYPDKYVELILKSLK